MMEFASESNSHTHTYTHAARDKSAEQLPSAITNSLSCTGVLAHNEIYIIHARSRDIFACIGVADSLAYE